MIRTEADDEIIEAGVRAARRESPAADGRVGFAQIHAAWVAMVAVASRDATPVGPRKVVFDADGRAVPPRPEFGDELWRQP